MTDTLTVRLDEDTRGALARLTAGGVPASTAVRAALMAADRAARREALRQEALSVARDPADRAEMAAVLREMASLAPAEDTDEG